MCIKVRDTVQRSGTMLKHRERNMNVDKSVSSARCNLFSFSSAILIFTCYYFCLLFFLFSLSFSWSFFFVNKSIRKLESEGDERAKRMTMDERSLTGK